VPFYGKPNSPATKDDFYDSGVLDHIQFRCERCNCAHASYNDVIYVRALPIQRVMEADMSETFQGREIVGRGDAESIAIQVLNFIVTDDDRIVQFLNVTGMQPETMREAAKSPDFLLGVLEYASKDEGMLKAIEQELGIRPAAILVAIVHLSPAIEVEPVEQPSGLKLPGLPKRKLFQ